MRSLTLHDSKDVQLRDLSAQFYLVEADVGKNRADACANRLQELNPAVVVSTSAAKLDTAFLSKFQVIGRPIGCEGS